VTFGRETELLEPVSAWLEASGFDVRVEVPILHRIADILGSRADQVTAVELKMHDWRGALRQAMAYQLAADRVWVAMPLVAASSAYRSRWRFEEERVGLLAIDDHGGVRVPIPAGDSPRLLPFLQTKILDSWDL
jgi:hypothetical protein